MASKIIHLFLYTILCTQCLNAQHLDTSLNENRKIRIASFIPAAVGVAYGFAALNTNFLRKVDDKINNTLNHEGRSQFANADDYLRYVPAAAVYGLDAFGIKGKNNFRDKTAILIISTAFTGITVNILKRSSNRMRPNRMNDYSFPSGHSATAFSSAEFLHQEYGDISAWYSVAGYSVAASTAIFRLYNGYHWFSDVVAGAGIGIMSTKFAYLVYPSIQRALFGTRKSSLIMMPTYQSGMAGLSVSGKF